jgi:metallo-beta-lactamase family protein
MARVTFYGACGTVTGSCTLLEWGQTRILVDRGMFQGSEDIEQRNWEPFPVPPEELTAVIVTHAHLDHTGLLPRLVAQGFDGPIHCTRAGRGLVSLILQDAGELQEEDVRYARRRRYSRHEHPEPLYTSAEVRKTLRLLEAHPFDAPFNPAEGVQVRFRRAGHLLGAASVEVSAKGADGSRRSWCFSGDLGRYDVPILKDPEPPLDPPAALLLESTYGDRRHEYGDIEEVLRKIIHDTFSRGGSVIIPAFAIGRTQEVLYHLSELADAGAFDSKAVFLDSPMAIRATKLYDSAEAEHDEDLEELERQGVDPLAPDRFNRCHTTQESKKLNAREQPAIIVASSGMATGGRVVHHLKQRLPDPRNTVIFVGFQAAGTKGRALVDGAQRVAFHGVPVPVRAEIHYLRQLSAHADCDELIRWCRAFPAPPKRVFLNHGEDPARKALAAQLRGELDWPAAILPQAGLTVDW